MSKPIDNYLDSVVDVYKEFVNKGELIPLEFNFPSFKVTKGVFNFYAVDSLSERVRIGVDSGSYGLQKFSDEINYDELVDYSSRKKMGLTTPTEDKTTGVLIEKVLAEKIKQDSSITATEARNGALASSCVKTMDYKVLELIAFDFFKPEPRLSEKEIRNENSAHDLLVGTKERIDFVATLVAMKEVLPQIHKKVWESLSDRQELANESVKQYAKAGLNSQKGMEESIKQNMQIAQLIGTLKEESANPSSRVLERALEVDPALKRNFVEKYPRVMKEVMSVKGNGVSFGM